MRFVSSIYCVWIVFFACAAQVEKSEKETSLLAQMKNFYGNQWIKDSDFLDQKKEGPSQSTSLFSETIKNNDQRPIYITQNIKMAPSLQAFLTAGMTPLSLSTTKESSTSVTKGWKKFIAQKKPSLFISLIYYFSSPNGK